MRMILLLNLVLLSMVGCGESNQQSTEQSEQEDTLELIGQANEYKLLIDSTKSGLDSLQRDIYESAEGGVVKSFYNSLDTLKKEIIYYGETGKRMIHIYQKQGNPVLIEDTEVRYTEPISAGKEVEISSSATDVYYLDDQQNLIYWLKDGQKMPEYQYKAQEKEIIRK